MENTVVFPKDKSEAIRFQKSSVKHYWPKRGLGNLDVPRTICRNAIAIIRKTK